MLPDTVLAARRWTGPTVGTEKQDKKKKCAVFFPPCVDLNDLTAITPKQKLEDKSCSCERVRRLTLQFPERTFCNPRRATSVLLRTRCVWICCRERQIVVASYVIKSISLPGSWEYCTRFHYWFGPEIPCCDCFLAPDFAFVLRRHTLGSDCQLTEHIPEIASGCQPTRQNSQEHAQATERCEVCVWASCATGYN